MASLLALIEDFDAEIERFERDVERELADHPGYHAIQAIPGVGPVFAAIFVAEIGDVTRFNSPALLCSWAGLIPRHRESGTTLVGPDHQAGLSPRALGGGRGGERQAGGTKLRADFARITANHGDTRGARKVARVAVARKIVTLVYYGARRHHPLEGHRGRVSGSGHHQARGRLLSWPPALRRGRALD